MPCACVIFADYLHPSHSGHLSITLNTEYGLSPYHGLFCQYRAIAYRHNEDIVLARYSANFPEKNTYKRCMVTLHQSALIATDDTGSYLVYRHFFR